MNHLSRASKIIFVIMIIYFSLSFFKNGYSLDSLKVGLDLQPFDQNQIDSLSQQSGRTLYLPQCQFRISFAPLSYSESDSSLLSFQQSLYDSLQQALTSHVLSKINFIEPDSSHGPEWTDTTLQRLGLLPQAQVVISGKIDKDAESNVRYHPHVEIVTPGDNPNPIYASERSLSGKTCQIKQFDLPAVTFNTLSDVIDFMAGYVFIQEKMYSEAIDKLNRLQSVPGYFYLAESYLYRGMTNELDLALSHADWDSSIFYWQKCLLQTDLHWDSVCVNNNLGMAFQLKGHLDSAIVYFTKANSNLKAGGDNDDFIRISHNLGNIYLVSGQWEKALDIFQSTVAAMEQLDDSLNLARTYENLGHIYQLIFQRDKAISYYSQSLDLWEKMHDDAGRANLFQFLGNIYQENKDFQRAKDYFKQSLALNIRLQHEFQIAHSCDKLGLVFQNLGEIDSALFYFQKGVETFNLLDDTNGLVQTMLHQAFLYQKQKDSKNAISLYEKALEIIENDNSKSLRAQIYDRLGDIYNNQDNLIPALDYYQQSADLYEQLGNYEILSLIFYNMGLIKLKQNDYLESYQLLKKAVAIDEEHGFHNLSDEQDFLRQLESMLGKN